MGLGAVGICYYVFSFCIVKHITKFLEITYKLSKYANSPNMTRGF